MIVACPPQLAALHLDFTRNCLRKALTLTWSQWTRCDRVAFCFILLNWYWGILTILEFPVTMESNRLWKNRRSPSDVCIFVCQVQWPCTQINLIERTLQIARLDAVTTPVDKEWVNSCVLRHLFLREFSNQKNRQNPPEMLYLTHY